MSLPCRCSSRSTGSGQDQGHVLHTECQLAPILSLCSDCRQGNGIGIAETEKRSLIAAARPEPDFSDTTHGRDDPLVDGRDFSGC